MSHNPQQEWKLSSQQVLSPGVWAAYVIGMYASKPTHDKHAATFEDSISAPCL